MPLRGTEGPRTLPERDRRRGFGFLRGVLFDAHVLVRNRQFDLIAMVNARPELFGVGVDENTAIVVRGDAFEVVGTSYALIYDNRRQVAAEADTDPSVSAGGPFYFLRAGDTYDMKTRQAKRNERPIARVVEQPWPGR
jgi:cyanophycinase